MMMAFNNIILGHLFEESSITVQMEHHLNFRAVKLRLAKDEDDDEPDCHAVSTHSCYEIHESKEVSFMINIVNV